MMKKPFYIIIFIILSLWQLIYAAEKLQVDGDLKIESTASDQRQGLNLRPQSQPATPTEGQVYYDNTNNQPYYYDGTIWRSLGSQGDDRRVATKIVAAYNSLDSKESDTSACEVGDTTCTNPQADYTCDGVNDQQEINKAINALPADGGIVYLLEGTYNISAVLLEGETTPGIVMHSYTSLIGAGRGTQLKVTALVSNVNVINASSISGILISQLMIDGNSKTGSNNNGIYFDTVTNSKIDKLWVEQMSKSGIWFDSSSNNTISGNNVQSNGFYGIYLSSSNNTISGNNVQSNGLYGIELNASSNNTISGNNVQSNGYGIDLNSSSNNTISGNNVQSNVDGIYLSFSARNTISGNNVQSNGSNGIYLVLSSNNTISGNNVQSNNQGGIHILRSANNNIISGNTIYNNGGSGAYDGIRMDDNSHNNIISSNLLHDSAGTGSPINIAAGTCDNNYLVGNLISTWPAGYADIADSGTNTKYTQKEKLTLERFTNTDGNIVSTQPYSYVLLQKAGYQTIANGKSVGDILILESNTPGGSPAVINSSGNVKLYGSSANNLTREDTLTLIWDGTYWVELYSADNTFP